MDLVFPESEPAGACLNYFSRQMALTFQNSPFCTLRITAYWRELGRVREDACGCCCCLASNSLYKSGLIEQQSVFTQQRLYLWSGKEAVLWSATYLKNSEMNCDFSRWKAHLSVCVAELFFTQSLSKNGKDNYQITLLFPQPFIPFQTYGRFGKRQSSLHNNKNSSHVDGTHFKF